MEITVRFWRSRGIRGVLQEESTEAEQEQEWGRGQAHTESRAEWRSEVWSEGGNFPGLGWTGVEVREWSRGGHEVE
jgi:hypothetical protein